MARPQKRKIEEVEATAHAGAEIDCDTGITGEVPPELEPISPVPSADAPGSPVRSAAQQKKWVAAKEAYEEAMLKAVVLREIATEQVQKQKLAERLFDAKMQRLHAGDKRQRRKRELGAAFRRYEALVELLQVQHKCEWTCCRAAEAETAAARTELRLMELAYSMHV